MLHQINRMKNDIKTSFKFQSLTSIPVQLKPFHASLLLPKSVAIVEKNLKISIK